MVHHPNISSPTSQVKVKLIFIVMSMLIEPSSISIVHRVCRFVGCQVVSGVPARKREMSRICQFLVRCTASGRAPPKSTPCERCARCCVCTVSTRRICHVRKDGCFAGRGALLRGVHEPDEGQGIPQQTQGEARQRKNVFMQREASRQATPSNPNLATPCLM